jgi:hypothetical protein
MTVQPPSVQSKLPQEYPEEEIDRPSEKSARNALMISIALVLVGFIMFAFVIKKPDFGPNSTVHIQNQNGPENVPFSRN